MADFPYLTNAARLREFLPKIQTMGIPEKATTRWLPAVGFGSTNDRAILRVLKSLGFLSPDGTPTELWRSYRSRKDAPRVLASAIRKAYGPLFQTYPDAQRKDDEAIRDFFKSHTTLSETVVTLMVRTFKTLCEMGDFDAVPGKATPPALEGERKLIASAATQVEAAGRGVTINLRIELALPASEDGAIYEKFFEAMKRHLLS